jgi:hypothetical protein
MRCIALALALGVMSVHTVHAQRVPGRDLLEFPIGSLAEPSALAVEVGDGFRNPASVVLRDKVRGRVTAASLITGSVQGLGAQLLAVSAALPERTTATLSIVRASVDDIARTETDPQSIGDVPYSTIVVSAVGARRHNGRVSSGLALRYRIGTLDQKHSTAIGVDGGVMVEHLLGVDGRFGASSFLWRPGNAGARETALSAAGDLRLFGDSTGESRFGVSYTRAEGLSHEGFAYLSGRIGPWEARGGVAQAHAYGTRATRLRLAMGLHYARYLVGVAREDNPSGLAPTYQFMLSTIIP